MGPTIAVIDNYDSFVYNLVQYLGELGAEPVVRRDDVCDAAELEALRPDGILISPGPGTPADAGASNEIIATWAGRVPILGVCLGMQCIAEVFGASVTRAPQVVHGKTSPIHHDGRGVFDGLPDPLEATRYHSLIVERASIPETLEITASTEDGIVMGLRHRHMAVEGVQFHPESVLTVGGHDMLGNFLAQCRKNR